MKHLFIFLITLIAIFNSYSQETVKNFKIDETNLVWQKVYETPMSFNELTEKVKDSGIFTTLDIREDKLSGDLVPISFDYIGAGYKLVNTPIYMTNDNFTGFVIIDYKEGKYRVTVKRIQAITTVDNPLSKSGDIFKAEEGALNNSKTAFRKSFYNAPGIIWDYTLSSIFDLKEKAKDNW